MPDSQSERNGSAGQGNRTSSADTAANCCRNRGAGSVARAVLRKSGAGICVLCMFDRRRGGQVRSKEMAGNEVIACMCELS